MSYQMTYEALVGRMRLSPGGRARVNGPEALAGMMDGYSWGQAFAIRVERTRDRFTGRDTVLGMREVGLAIGGLRGPTRSSLPFATATSIEKATTISTRRPIRRWSTRSRNRC
jgi:hypothetical protein